MTPTKKLMKLTAAMFGMLALLLAAQVSASAQEEGGNLNVSPSSAQPGDPIEVRGQCSPADAGGTVGVLAGDGFIEPGFWGDATVSEDGSFSATLTVPENAPPATGELMANCEVSQQMQTTQFTIESGDRDDGTTPGGGVDAGAGGTASTGLPLVVTGTAAAGLLLLLTGLVMRARRGIQS